jgi:hypothetical protein
MQETRISRLLKEARAKASQPHELRRPETPLEVGRQLTSRGVDGRRTIFTKRLAALGTPITPPDSQSSPFDLDTPTTLNNSASTNDESLAKATAIISVLPPADTLAFYQSWKEAHEAIGALESALKANTAGAVDAQKHVLVEDHLRFLFDAVNTAPSSRTIESGATNPQEMEQKQQHAEKWRELRLAFRAAVLLFHSLPTPPSAALRYLAEHAIYNPSALRREKLLDPLLQFIRRESPSRALQYALRAIRRAASGDAETQRSVITMGIVPALLEVFQSTEKYYEEQLNLQQKSRSEQGGEVRSPVPPGTPSFLTPTKTPAGSGGQSNGFLVAAEILRQGIDLCRVLCDCEGAPFLHLACKLGLTTHLVDPLFQVVWLDCSLMVPLSRTIARLISAEDGLAVILPMAPDLIPPLAEAVLHHQWTPIVVSRLSYTLARLLELSEDARDVMTGPLMDRYLSLILAASSLCTEAISEVSSSADSLPGQLPPGMADDEGADDSTGDGLDLSKTFAGPEWFSTKLQSLGYLIRIFSNAILDPRCGEISISRTSLLDRLLVPASNLALTIVTLRGLDRDRQNSSPISSPVRSSPEMDALASDNASLTVAREVYLCVANLSYYLQLLEHDEDLLSILLEMMGPILLHGLGAEYADMRVVLSAATRGLSNLAAVRVGRRWLEQNCSIAGQLLHLLSHAEFSVVFSVMGIFLNLAADPKASLYHQDHLSSSGRSLKGSSPTAEGCSKLLASLEENLDILRSSIEQAGAGAKSPHELFAVATMTDEEREILVELDRQIRANVEANLKPTSTEVPKA